MPSRIKSVSTLPRRRFLSFCGAGIAAPRSLPAQAGPLSNPDVVIIGAGAAGIAAAHHLREAGVPYLHIEAGSRVGGRAHTEIKSFGVPHDRGAHWVQNEGSNPYFNRAKAGDWTFYEAPDTYGIYTQTGPATEDEIAAMWTAWNKVSAAIGQAGRAGRDVSPASVAPSDDTWSKTAWFGIGPWEMAKDMEDFSCLDWWNSSDSNDWYCAEGYGALVAHHARDLPVALDTQATLIRWSGPGVEVETSRGTIRARAVILTVSTGVLARGEIAFDPTLPPEKLESFDAISMGHYNHITLRFGEDIFGLGPDGYVLHQVPDGREGFGALTNASGTGLAYCDVGGSFALELERAGPEAAIDFVRAKLRGMIGRDADTHFTSAAVTGWTADPRFRGAYASALPGTTAMRDVLRAPVGERIFFAGEACHPSLWATVDGADLSGRETAAQVAERLAR